MAEQSRETRKRDYIIILVLIGAVIAVAVYLIWTMKSSYNGDSEGGTQLGVSSTDIPQLSAEMFKVSAATHITVDSDGMCDPLIENSSSNSYPCWVEIRSDDGAVMYETGILEPGYKVQKMPFPTQLEVGLHNCVISFHVMLEASKNAAEINVIDINAVIEQE